jgi:hypothetical protein
MFSFNYGVVCWYRETVAIEIGPTCPAQAISAADFLLDLSERAFEILAAAHFSLPTDNKGTLSPP